MLERLVVSEIFPNPPDARFMHLITADGASIRAAFWNTKSRRKRGTICLMQGRSEFIEKYFEVVNELRLRGFAVLTFDWRGQGGSDRNLEDHLKGHIDDFELYGRDLDTVLAQLLPLGAPKPWFGLAHSMGAAVLLLALNAGESRLERVVLASPMIQLAGIRLPKLTVTIAAMLDFLGLGGSFIPRGGRSVLSSKPFAGNKLSSDKTRYERTATILSLEPSLAVGDPTIGWAAAAFRAMREFADPEFGDRLIIPTLIFSGGADQICRKEASAELATRLRHSSFIELTGAAHEIMMERDSIRQQFWSAFDAFIPGELGEVQPIPEEAVA